MLSVLVPLKEYCDKYNFKAVAVSREFLVVLVGCHVLFPAWPLQEGEIFKGEIIHMTCADQ